MQKVGGPQSNNGVNRPGTPPEATRQAERLAASTPRSPNPPRQIAALRSLSGERTGPHAVPRTPGDFRFQAVSGGHAQAAPSRPGSVPVQTLRRLPIEETREAGQKAFKNHAEALQAVCSREMARLKPDDPVNERLMSVEQMAEGYILNEIKREHGIIAGTLEKPLGMMKLALPPALEQKAGGPDVNEDRYVTLGDICTLPPECTDGVKSVGSALINAAVNFSVDHQFGGRLELFDATEQARNGGKSIYDHMGFKVRNGFNKYFDPATANPEQWQPGENGHYRYVPSKKNNLVDMTG